MQALQTGVASSVGSRMLGEIEDTSLDQILTSLRANFTNARHHAGKGKDIDNYNPDNEDEKFHHIGQASTALKTFPIAQLDLLVQRHFRATQSAPLALTGRYHELLYVLVATLIARPHEKAVAIIDFEGRFDPLRILATAPYEEDEPHKMESFPESVDQSKMQNDTNAKQYVRQADLDHVHIMRPIRGDAAYMAKCVASVEEYMLYGDHPSRTREWWGTIVIGGGHNPAGNPVASASAQVAVTAGWKGWKGWLRVDRAASDAVLGFMPGTSLEEALDAREEHQRLVEKAGWVATCPWGQFTFGGDAAT
ncbi:hypothetical protein V8F33_012676 [Rhypophila sp. PSN 637]